MGLSVAANDLENDDDGDDSEVAPLDSQGSDVDRKNDMMLISEEVRNQGLPVSDETLKMAKVLLPDGEQVH